jgi:nicotinamide riboside transporter PnuC
MNYIELLSIILGIGQVIGIALLAQKNKNGFIVGNICNVFWVVYVLLTNSTYGLLLTCVFAFVINTFGYIKWKNVVDKKPTTNKPHTQCPKCNSSRICFWTCHDRYGCYDCDWVEEKPKK